MFDKFTGILKYLNYLIYSLSLVLIWGLLLLDVERPGSLGMLIAFIYTFYSSWILRHGRLNEDRTAMMIKFSLPALYLIAFLATGRFSVHVLLNPLMIAFVALLLGHTLRAPRTQIALQFFAAMGMYLYTFSLYNYWHQWEQRQVMEKYDFRDLQSVNVRPIELFSFAFQDSINITSLTFQSELSDQARIQLQGKPVIIETWNERCIPCLRAIRDLQQFFGEKSGEIDHYYLYIPERDIKVNLDHVFGFMEIRNRERILADTQYQLYDAMRISGYPYFLIFDSSGKLSYVQFGYRSELQSAIQEKILHLIRPLAYQ